MVNEYDIVRAFFAGGHKPAANNLRRLTPFRDGENGAGTRVERFPSNTVYGDDWQEPMSSCDQGQSVLDSVRADNRVQHPPRCALVYSGNRIGKGVW